MIEMRSQGPDASKPELLLMSFPSDGWSEGALESTIDYMIDSAGALARTSEDLWIAVVVDDLQVARFMGTESDRECPEAAMRAKKMAACVVVAVVLPPVIGASVDPWEDRLTVLWAKGALAGGLGLVLAWAVEQFREGDPE